MPRTPLPTPVRGFEERYLARPLVLAAVLVIAGHQIRGAPAGPAVNNEEVQRHE